MLILAWVAFSHQTAYMGTVGGVGRGGGCWREGGTDDVFIGGWVALVRECGLNKEVLMVVRVAWVVLMLLEGVWHVLVVWGREDGQVVGSVALVNLLINSNSHRSKKENTADKDFMSPGTAYKASSLLMQYLNIIALPSSFSSNIHVSLNSSLL